MCPAQAARIEAKNLLFGLAPEPHDPGAIRVCRVLLPDDPGAAMGPCRTGRLLKALNYFQADGERCAWFVKTPSFPPVSTTEEFTCDPGGEQS
jgi:hypothetical protein